MSVDAGLRPKLQGPGVQRRAEDTAPDAGREQSGRPGAALPSTGERVSDRVSICAGHAELVRHPCILGERPIPVNVGPCSTRAAEKRLQKPAHLGEETSEPGLGGREGRGALETERSTCAKPWSEPLTRRRGSRQVSVAKRLAKLSLNAGPFSTGGKEEAAHWGRYGPVSAKPPEVLR